MDVLIRDIYCYDCSLQFDTKCVFDIHLSVVHGEKLDIKQESDSQPSVIHKELEIKHQDEENTQKNESKRKKVSMKTASGQKGKEKFKCHICNAKFEQKGDLTEHVITVHEGKKPFQCGICNANFGQKGTLKKHVATVQKEKNQM